MADTTIVGTLTQSTTSSTHLQRDVSTILSKYEKDRFPLDTLLRLMPNGKPAKAVKYEWESYQTMDRKAVVQADSTAGVNATTAAVISVDTSGVFVPDDILMVVSTSNLAVIPDTTFPQLIVTATGSGTVSVKAFSTVSDTAYVATPIIPAGSILTFIGNAKKEGFTMSDAKMITPIAEYNYCQLFDTTVKVSLTRKATTNYTTQHDWDTARQEQLIEFRRSLEYTSWFGKRAETNDATNDGGEKRWKMNGLTRYITQKIDYKPSTLSEGDLLDWLKVAFSGNNGSAKRMFFVDNELSTAIQKTQLAKAQSMETVRVAGLTCTRIVYNEGELYMKLTPGFREAGLQHYGVIVDMKNIAKKVLRPMTRKRINLEDQGTDADAEQYKEQSTIEVLNPNTHVIVQGQLA